MATNTRRIKTDFDGKPIAQGFNIDIDDFEPSQSLAGGASSHVLGSIIHDTWSGSANITKNFTKLCVGFSLKNDGSTDVTVTINTLTFVVKGGESFNGNFEPFSSLTITTTSAYRALVAR